MLAEGLSIAEKDNHATYSKVSFFHLGVVMTYKK
jgi:hypothetical protein